MTIPVSRDTQLKRARLYPDVVHMSLDDARVCLDCDTIHTGDVCPVCASVYYMVLSSVIGRLPHNSLFQKEATTEATPDKPLLRVMGGN